MSKRKSSSTESISKKSKQTLEEEIETIQLICDLKTNNPLLRNFNNITKWMNLVELTLSNNEIVDLPMQLGTLPCLQNLNLSQNKIGLSQQHGWQWIMQPEIRNTLQVLDISKNKIGDLPVQLGNLSCLQYLNLSQNNIGLSQQHGWQWIMQPEIRNTLELLNISENKIRDLPVQLGNLSCLEHLNLSQNSIGISQRYGWQWIMQPEIRNTLQELNISENKIGDLPIQLGNLSCLEYLNLSKNNIGISQRHGWQWIMQPEIRNTLRLLNISKNKIGELPMQLGNLSCLQNLDLSKNNIGISQRHGWQWIMQPEIRNTLIKLNISKNKIGDLPMQLGNLSCLQRLDLSQNNIGISQRYGWLWIMQPEIRKTLRYLNMSKNSITELPDYIGKLNALMELIISHNKLRHLPHTIGNMTRLELLDVSYNSLLYLPYEIFKLSALNYLYISMNPRITDQIDTKVNELDPPTLTEFSSAILQQERIELRRILPNCSILIDYMDSIRRCYYCNQYGKAFLQEITSRDLNSLCIQDKKKEDRRMIDIEMSEESEEMNDPKITVECVRCSPDCPK